MLKRVVGDFAAVTISLAGFGKTAVGTVAEIFFQACNAQSPALC